MKYLLDTDICIDLVNRSLGYKNILSRIGTKEYGQVLISSISIAELQYGTSQRAWKYQNKIKLQLLIARFQTLAFDDKAAKIYGQIRTDLEIQGVGMGPLDTLLVAQALSVKAIMVTRNTREFSRAKSLRVQNWLLD